MTQIFVKPIEGAQVRKPDSMDHIDQAGEFLEHSSYLERRRLRGEVEFLSGPEEKKTGKK